MPAAPAGVNQVSQIGIETTYGSLPSGGANRKLAGLSIVGDTEVEAQSFTAQGYKNPTSRPITKQWAQLAYNGPLDFNTFLYLLASLAGVSGPTGTTGKVWTSAPASSGADSTAKSLAIQIGEGSAAQQWLGCKVTSLSLNSTQDGVNVSGVILGRFPTDGVTLTASPTVIASRPVTRNMINAYIDSTFAGIGTTKITDIYEENLTIAQKDIPFWVHNTDYTSFKELVEQPYDILYTFKTAHNAQSRAQFNLISSNVNQFLRWNATGLLLEVGVNELAQFDVAATIIGAKPMYNDGRVYGYEYQMGVLHDTTFGGAISAKNINLLAAL